MLEVRKSGVTLLASGLVRGDAFSVYAQILSEVQADARYFTAAISRAGQDRLFAPDLILLVSIFDIVFSATLALLRAGMDFTLEVHHTRAEVLAALARSAVLEHAAAALLCLDEALTVAFAAAQAADEDVAAHGLSGQGDAAAGDGNGAGLGAGPAGVTDAAAAAQGIDAAADEGHSVHRSGAAVRPAVSDQLYEEIVFVRSNYDALLERVHSLLDRYEDWPSPAPAPAPGRPAALVPPAAAAAPPGASAAAVPTAPDMQRRQMWEQHKQQEEQRRQQRQELLLQIFSGPALQLLSALSLEQARAWEQQQQQQGMGLAQAASQAEGPGTSAPGVTASTAPAVARQRAGGVAGSGTVPWLRRGERAAWGPAAVPAVCSDGAHGGVLEAGAQLVFSLEAAAYVLGYRAAADPDPGAAATAAGAAAGSVQQQQWQQQQERSRALSLHYRAEHVFGVLQRCAAAVQPAVQGHEPPQPRDHQRILQRWWGVLHVLVRLFGQLRPRQAAARLPALWMLVVPALPLLVHFRELHWEALGQLADVLASPAPADQAAVAAAAPAAAADSGSSSSTRQHADPAGCGHSLRCALDAGLLPALEQLLRGAVAGIAAPGPSVSAPVVNAGSAGSALATLLCESGVWPAVLAHGPVEQVVPLVATLGRVAAVVADAAAPASVANGFSYAAGKSLRFTACVCLSLAALLEQQQQQAVAVAVAAAGQGAAPAGSAAAGAQVGQVGQEEAGMPSHADGLALSHWLGCKRGRGEGAAAGMGPGGAVAATAAAVQRHRHRQWLADWAALQWLPVLLQPRVVRLMADPMLGSPPAHVARLGALLTARLSRSLVSLCRHYLAAVWRYSRSERAAGGQPLFREVLRLVVLTAAGADAVMARLAAQTLCLAWHAALSGATTTSSIGLSAALADAAALFGAAVQRLQATDGAAGSGSAAAAGAAAAAGGRTGGADGGGRQATGPEPGAPDPGQAGCGGWDPEATADAAALAAAVMDMAEVDVAHTWFDNALNAQDDIYSLVVLPGSTDGTISGAELLMWLQRFGLRQRPRLEAVLWAPYREEEEPQAPAAAAASAAAAATAAVSRSARPHHQHQGGAAVGRQQLQQPRQQQLQLRRRSGRGRRGGRHLDDTDARCALVRDPKVLAQQLLHASRPAAVVEEARARAAGAAAATGAAGASGSAAGAAGASGTSVPPRWNVAGVGLCCNPPCRNLDGPTVLLPPGAAKVCARCRAVCYCCGACQLAHWRHGHEQECAGNADTSLNRSFLAVASYYGVVPGA
ncbi:hypothetical protein HXX76_010510 [Chlamydomonas incerta]|uniref:phytol kinase n=1 Tax=Chlamydomonas incerta TaxID=51695 RepID=A0A835VX55_CHLIN|nr:hypothetical protein HXX76_010510 [Chlamydomonas incerta]|eukprot:KAG2428366.1 hypothetical protein HXX76_010510 [Chlamydomonas incerta]